MDNGSKSILYIGQIYKGGTCLMRLQTLQTMGNNTITIDTTQELNYFQRLLWGIMSRMGLLLDTANINKHILSIIKDHNIDIVWIDKGTLIKKSTLLQVKNYSPNTLLLHYNPDDPFGYFEQKGWQYFIESIPYYDVHFVPRYQNIREYQLKGAKQVFFLIPTRGFHPTIHYPREVDPETKLRLGGTIGFIGSYEEERSTYLNTLANKGFKVRIWGNNWHNSSYNSNLVIENCALYGNDYALALSSFDIVLCFLRKGNRDKHTSRSIEIPACGAFMLAERTDEHMNLFDEGKEAEFFSSSEELLDKVQYYLKHPEQRKRIATAGQERCLKSGYSYHERLKKMLEIVSEVEK